MLIPMILFPRLLCRAAVLPVAVLALAWGVPAAVRAQASRIPAAAAAQTTAVLETLRTLTAIESGSRDLEGLARMAEAVATRLSAAGMEVQVIPAQAPEFNPQLKGATLGSMVYARRTGTGSRKVLLIAHMDTVYPRGTGSRQPFRVDGDRAYGLGISDDKGGVALILHCVELLRQLGLDGYAQLGVLINGDEEIGSAGSRAMIAQLGSEYDAVLSFEGGGFEVDQVRLATSSIASAELKITGKASHAGGNPEGGRNALYEMAHQVLKSRNLGDPARGLKINWTIASAGQTLNVIPDSASARADIRADTAADLDRIEAALRDSIREHLIPDTRIELAFVRGRPAFQGNAASRMLARHAQSVFQEFGLPLRILERPSGGGTDAAYAGLNPRGGVLESFGLRGYGAHSSDDEYIFISSIAPRLALAARMVVDVGTGTPRW